MKTSPPLSLSTLLQHALRNASQIFIILGLSVVIRYLSQVTLARLLSPSDFGRISYVTAAIEFISIPASLGMGVLCVRFLPAYIQNKKWELALGFLRYIQWRLIAAALCSALLFVILAHYGLLPKLLLDLLQAYPRMLAIVAALFPLSAFIQLNWQRHRAWGGNASAIIPNMLLRPLLILLLALMIAGDDESMGMLNLSQGLWILFFALAAVVVIQEILFARLTAQPLMGIKPRLEKRQWSSALPAILLGLLYFQFLSLADLLILGWFTDASSVALYQVAAKTALLTQLFWVAADTALGPQISRLGSPDFQQNSKDRQSLITLLKRSTQWIFWPTLLTWLLFLCFGPWLLSWFGPIYAQAHPELLIISASFLISAGFGLCPTLLNYTGHHKVVTRAYLIGAVSQLLFSLILIPNYGRIGAAVALVLATLIWNLYGYWQSHRHLGFTTSLALRLRSMP